MRVVKDWLIAGALLVLFAGCGEGSRDTAGPLADGGRDSRRPELESTADPTTSSTLETAPAVVRPDTGLVHAYFRFSDTSDEVVEPVSITFRIDGEVIGGPVELSAADGDVDRTMDVPHGPHEITVSWGEHEETMPVEIDDEAEWFGIRWAGRHAGFIIEQYDEAPFWTG